LADPIGRVERSEGRSLNCNGRHGPEGISAADYIPTISGLNFRHFFSSMLRFKKDRRASSVMERIAKGYRMGQLQRMALHFGSQPWKVTGAGGDSDLLRRGREIHAKYCEKCHEDNGHHQDKETPPLAGQSRGYLLPQMRDYRVAATGMPQHSGLVAASASRGDGESADRDPVPIVAPVRGRSRPAPNPIR
jgi:sulfide dehydrogenase cytochrome subunit